MNRRWWWWWSIAAAVSASAGACASVQQAPPTTLEPRYGEAWFAVRGEQLGLDAEAAKSRDAALAEDRPPAGLDDPRMTEEGARLWGALCVKCHGADGAPPENVELETRPRTWGGMG